jgi:hypothetical protein
MSSQVATRGSQPNRASPGPIYKVDQATRDLATQFGSGLPTVMMVFVFCIVRSTLFSQVDRLVIMIDNQADRQMGPGSRSHGWAGLQ